MTSTLRLFPWCIAFAVAVSFLATTHSALAADNSEADLIRVLQSDSPPQDKAITCKKLAIYGSKNAVPALAPLLTDEHLASWARIALEAIPDSAADDALRDALTKVQGRLLIGVINSIGVRRDAKAVSGLTEKLNGADTEIAMAAAEAMGKIGGAPATKTLEEALSIDNAKVRSSAAYGCALCAEQLLADGNTAEATRLYDHVRMANLPKQRILEATRGAILGRGQGGIPLLIEQLKSPDIALFGIGLRTARELPGRPVTEALATELDQAGGDRQGPLLLALADRTDESVLPKVLQIAERGPKAVRVAALGLLDRFRDLSCVPVLLSAATESDSEIAAPAKNSLARLGGREVDADLLARLRLANGKSRQVLIDLAKQRRITGSLPIVLRSAEDADSGVRRAAIEAIGVLGTDQQADDLVRFLPTAQKLEDREDIEAALVALCGRNGTRCLAAVLPLASNSDAPLRVVALHALASMGGSEALSALKSAVNDQDGTVQDEAVRTLSNWPSTWPDDSGPAEPLLNLAQSGKKASHRLQGLQGYLQYIQETKKRSADEKLTKINDLAPIIKTAEEQRLIVSALGTIPSRGALERLVSFADEPSVVEEACQAILRVAGDRNLRDASAQARRGALEKVMAKSENETTKKRASDLLKRIK